MCDDNHGPFHRSHRRDDWILAGVLLGVIGLCIVLVTAMSIRLWRTPPSALPEAAASPR